MGDSLWFPLGGFIILKKMGHLGTSIKNVYMIPVHLFKSWWFVPFLLSDLIWWIQGMGHGVPQFKWWDLWEVSYMLIFNVWHNFQGLWFLYSFYPIWTLLVVDSDVGPFYDFPSFLDLYSIFPIFVCSFSSKDIIFCAIFSNHMWIPW